MPTRRRPLASRWRLLPLIGLGFAVLLLALPALASASTYVVNSLGDSYSPFGCEDELECTLRTAIVKANANEGEDTIEFEVEGTIEVEPEPLPAITDPVTIDAETLPAYSGVPLVEIDGTNAEAEGATEGLALLGGSGGSWILGLAIGGFQGGVRVAGQSPSHLCGSYLGVELDGTTALPNFNGVETDGVGAKIGADCFGFGGNLISGNSAYGVVDFGESTTIARNRIGVDATGAPLPNGPSGGVGAGVLVSQFAKSPTIGGVDGGEGGPPGNEIADNNGYGVLIEEGGANAAVRTNSIHGNSVGAIEILTGPETPAPVLSFASLQVETATAFGELQGEPNEEYEVDFYAGPSCYPSGAGEGREYIGTEFVNTDASGEATILDEELDEPSAGYEYFTATATAVETGATSVISQCWDQPPGVAVGTVPNGISSSSEGTFEFIGLDANGSVAGFECRIDGGPFETCSSPQTYTDLADGSHHFELRAIDQVGTVQPEPFTYTWTVDTTYPVESYELTPANPTNQASGEFRFSTSDEGGSGVRKVECSLDGSELAPCTSPVNVGPLVDGEHEFQVWATDWAGHTSFDPYSWTVDTSAPTVEIESEPPSLTSSGEATFTFSGDDGEGTGVSGFECSLDGEPFATCSSPKTYTGLGDGQHSFEVKAVDAAGNASDPASYSWSVDATPPTIEIQSTPPDPTSQQFGTFEFSATDSGSGIAKTECRFDGTPLTNCSSPDSISPLADGPHVFEVKATDNAGNSRSETYDWTVDSTAPETSIGSKPNDPSGSGDASFEFSGNDGDGTGVSGFECRIDSGQFAECNSPKAFSGLPDGPHTFEVRAFDGAGNRDETPAAYTWTVDTSAPTVAIESEPPSVSGSLEATFSFGGDDGDGSGVSRFECSLDSAAFSPCTSPKTYTGLADGSHNFEVKSIDDVDNASDPASYDWTVDATAPDTSIDSQPSNPSSSTGPSFEFSGTDPGGTGVSGFECRLDSEPFGECNSPNVLSGLADGSHTFEVRAFDGAGNRDATPAAYTWTVDTSAPTVTIQSEPPSVSASREATFTFGGEDGDGSGVARFECSIDGAAFSTCSSPKTYTGLADGSHNFEVKSIDGVGNTSDPASYDWTVDATAPETSIDAKPANPSSSTGPSFGFSGTDPGGSGVAGFECRLDSEAFAECTSPKALSGLADGSHTFEVRSFDTAGNRDASPAAYTWTVESATPAAPQLTGTTPASPATDTTPVIKGTAPAGTAVTLYASGNCSGEPVATGATPAQFEAGIEVTVAANAVTQFSATATSPAEVTSSCSSPLSYREDSTTPDTTIDSKPANPSGSNAPSFTFSGTDPGGSGVAGFECRLDAGAFAACTSPKALSGLADGSHTFEVRSFDGAGNKDATPAAYTWTVDTSGPGATIESEPPSLTNSGEATFTFSGEGGADNFECSLDGERFEACSSPQTYTDLADGPHGFEVEAIDGVGNTGAPAAYSWTVDSTPPTTAIESQPAPSSGSETASFTFSGGDPGGSGVSHFECSLDGGAFAPCTSPQEYTGLAPGSHSFEVRAVDDAGNADAPSTYTWTVASSSASVQLSSSAPVQSGSPPTETGPAPSNGESVAVAPEGGKVFVQRPGQKKPTELREGETIPVGSLVDATNGRVLLTSVNAAGEAQSAYFFGGKFLVTQHEGSGLVILKLRGSLICAGASASGALATASAKAGRRLWGSGHGNFRTEGSSGSATVRGTIWLTEDRCDGSTFFRVRRGIVSVRDFTKEKTISLPAGNTYLAGP
jgi:hypothetical protein